MISHNPVHLAVLLTMMCCGLSISTSNAHKCPKDPTFIKHQKRYLLYPYKPVVEGVSKNGGCGHNQVTSKELVPYRLGSPRVHVVCPHDDLDSLRSDGERDHVVLLTAESYGRSQEPHNLDEVSLHHAGTGRLLNITRCPPIKLIFNPHDGPCS